MARSTVNAGHSAIKALATWKIRLPTDHPQQRGIGQRPEQLPDAAERMAIIAATLTTILGLASDGVVTPRTLAETTAIRC